MIPILSTKAEQVKHIPVTRVSELEYKLLYGIKIKIGLQQCASIVWRRLGVENDIDKRPNDDIDSIEDSLSYFVDIGSVANDYLLWDHTNPPVLR